MATIARGHGRKPEFMGTDLGLVLGSRQPKNRPPMKSALTSQGFVRGIHRIALSPSASVTSVASV